MEHLKNISPIDGRYKKACGELSAFFSEHALIKHRIIVEVRWLLFLNEEELFFEKVTDHSVEVLNQIATNITDSDIARVKAIEEETNHDVKAVEYFVKEKLKNSKREDLLKIKEYVHYLCTSEDINNVAYATCLKACLNDVVIPCLEKIMLKLKDLAVEYSHVPLLSRTHGQPASSTTFGKEMANFYARIHHHVGVIRRVKVCAKFNGAVGNFNAHKVASKDTDWVNTIGLFLKKHFNLTYSIYCTQIQDHDYICELCDGLARANGTLIDLCVDIWLYISNNLLKLKVKEKEVGSSTMPHKVNPIDFENAEGNLHIANAFFKLFSSKLPTSRLQRDLSDSTVLRNIGSSLAYCLIAYKSVLKGLNKIDIDRRNLEEELNQNWSTLAEPIQIVMKRHNYVDAYEELKQFTRGKVIDQKIMQEFIKTKCAFLPQDVVDQLLELTPATYTGYADYLAKNVERLSGERD
ncbi:adenylosuccinate lyase [Plasmodium vivax]|uniref:Adenylosuccinate lyase n=5 Tax=Plasmodium vivax TaxID=5855 RepID=A5KBL5_PLAVS|nr:adenylosuccinate lyase [Plasmodium vivax]KMZ82158.1 adenylosuccinate lyase [Plasmodium vivax India VII]KMZ94822.1 adenylosuccinate lyase [Plasmodium vivax Mauritania I]KNA01468.1 adenylosuccinate lyase [Plasmodium vivax North Korean]EDL43265.1 adenylosuccinate lyase [Plasmodium vivax]CAI7718550.1 adenylosuccinate lyase [Plasmodium vivax]|eukprot:XP_001612992.1 adenylosuccinate lyase [Plasmodium vivax Sal-1]